MSEMTRKARRASSWAPLCTVATAVLSAMPTVTATLTLLGALGPPAWASVVLSAERLYYWAIVALTSRSSLDFNDAVSRMSLVTSWLP